MIARGTVRAVSGREIEGNMPRCAIGTSVRISANGRTLFGVISAVGSFGVRIAAQGAVDGIVPGAAIVEELENARSVLGLAAAGRAIDALGNPLDGGTALSPTPLPLDASAPTPMERRPVERPMWTGVKVIDALLTIGRGARIGVFGGPGLGKSTLMEAMVRGTAADAVVLGLIGERGREAQECIARRERSSIVVATSDRSAAERTRAAHVAVAQAAALARRGLHVLLILDSLARFASAQRELAIAAGEPVGRGGFPPSVFSEVAALVERAGEFASGSVTLVATVLSDGDERDPVSDATRALLDGHIQLCSRRAQAGRFPAVDVLASASRTMSNVIGPRHRAAAAAVRHAIALLSEVSEARSLGIEPVDAATRRAIAAEHEIEQLRCQGAQPEMPERALALLYQTADTLGESYEYCL